MLTIIPQQFSHQKAPEASQSFSPLCRPLAPLFGPLGNPGLTGATEVLLGTFYGRLGVNSQSDILPNSKPSGETV